MPRHGKSFLRRAGLKEYDCDFGRLRFSDRLRERREAISTVGNSMRRIAEDEQFSGFVEADNH
jgi:hypothetical protein